MVRKTIFTMMFLAVIGCVSAQSLRFEWNGQVYSEGEEIVCTNDEYGYGEYIQHMQLRNLTSGDLNVIVEKEVLEDLEGTMNFFCWGQCYSSAVFVSDTVTVVANSLNTDDLSFHTLFEEPVFGKVLVKYSAYDANHPNERVSINVIFHKSDVGMNEMASVYFGQPYPNPANSMVSFDYHLSGNSADAVVYNLVGQEVMRQEINTFDKRVSLSVADFNDGIYFCSVICNGQNLATVKFVVRK